MFDFSISDEDRGQFYKCDSLFLDVGFQTMKHIAAKHGQLFHSREKCVENISRDVFMGRFLYKKYRVRCM